MSREALPGVIDTVDIISLSVVVGGLLRVLLLRSSLAVPGGNCSCFIQTPSRPGLIVKPLVGRLLGVFSPPSSISGHSTVLCQHRWPFVVEIDLGGTAPDRAKAIGRDFKRRVLSGLYFQEVWT